MPAQSRHAHAERIPGQRIVFVGQQGQLVLLNGSEHVSPRMALVRADVHGQRTKQTDVRCGQKETVFQRLSGTFDHIRRSEAQERPEGKPRAETDTQTRGSLPAQCLVLRLQPGGVQIGMTKNQTVQTEPSAKHGPIPRLHEGFPAQSGHLSHKMFRLRRRADDRIVVPDPCEIHMQQGQSEPLMADAGLSQPGQKISMPQKSGQRIGTMRDAILFMRGGCQRQGPFLGQKGQGISGFELPRRIAKMEYLRHRIEFADLKQDDLPLVQRLQAFAVLPGRARNN